MKVQVIRASKTNYANYMDKAGDRFLRMIPHKSHDVLDYTQVLTYKRQWLVDNGYVDVVERTDKWFLEKYRTGERKERFEEFWESYAETYPERKEKYKDAL